VADNSDLVQMTLNVGIPSDSPDELDIESRRLRRELREADFTVVESRAPAPVGSKSPEAFTLGALTVALLPKVVPQLIEVLGRWLGSRANRKLKLKLPNGLECELTGSMSTSEVNKLINTLISKKANAAAAGK
jgi:hypothetical protein